MHNSMRLLPNILLHHSFRVLVVIRIIFLFSRFGCDRFLFSVGFVISSLNTLFISIFFATLDKQFWWQYVCFLFHFSVIHLKLLLPLEVLWQFLTWLDKIAFYISKCELKCRNITHNKIKTATYNTSQLWFQWMKMAQLVLSIQEVLRNIREKTQ